MDVMEDKKGWGNPEVEVMRVTMRPTVTLRPECRRGVYGLVQISLMKLTKATGQDRVRGKRK